MSSDSQDTGSVETALVIQAIKYYVVIGVGAGVLGVILITRFVNDGTDSTLAGGILTSVILFYSVLSGPIIAAIVGYILNQEGTAAPRIRAVSSIVANGIGYIVYGVIVTLFIVVGLSAIMETGSTGGVSNGTTGGSTTEFFEMLGGIMMMMVPTALTGGLITIISKDISANQISKYENVNQKDNIQDNSLSTILLGDDSMKSMLIIVAAIISVVVVSTPLVADAGLGESTINLLSVILLSLPMVLSFISGFYRLPIFIPIIISILWMSIPILTGGAEIAPMLLLAQTILATLTHKFVSALAT